MKNILDEIIANKRIEVAKKKEKISISILEKSIENCSIRKSFKDALVNSDTGIISEFKRKSPSKGWMFENAQVADIIPHYSAAGASAISVLTDNKYFGGQLSDLKEASLLTDTPLLRKDFTIDEYQIYEAKSAGASAILLIASALTPSEVKQFAKKAKLLDLDVLLEIHNTEELDHINEYVDVVGVNNRNLGTFSTDIETSFDLVDKIPDEFIKISESGISASQTVLDLRRVGFRGFLMGENFMKTENPGDALAQFIKELRR